MAWQVRPARPDEWREAKRLRLEMLADTPIAFLSTLADGEARSDEQWQAAHAQACGEGSLYVVAVDDAGRWLGQAIGKDFGPVTESQPVLPGIVSLYLSPETRGQGGVGVLFEEIYAWLRARGHDRVSLMVHEDNPRAIGAYEKLGFVLDGTLCAYRLDPSRRELGMVREL